MQVISSALSNQSFVHDGVTYDEAYPLGHKDPDSLSEDRSLSASSPSSRDEGLEMGRLEDDDVVDDAEPPIQSVIGPDGLWEFIMLPIWTINDFTSTIKKSHFKTLREKYQKPVNVPLRLPYMSEKYYYEGIEGVGVYE